MGKQYMIVNGIEFTVEKPISNIVLTCDYSRDLFDCYERPSMRKQSIWYSWLEWASMLPGSCQLCVSSFNAQFFTIRGLWCREDGKKYFLYITKTRQEISEVIE